MRRSGITVNREAAALDQEKGSRRDRPRRGVDLSRKTWLNDPKRSLFVVAFLAIASLLVTRPIGIAPDDFSYLAYFENADWLGFLEWSEVHGYSLFVEEPLWQFLAYALSLHLEPETAFRLVVFCSVALYAWAFRNAHSSALLFVLFAFLACSSMFTQVYFNQLRQGLAISAFLAFLSLGRWGYAGGAIVSGLLHTSQLALLPLSPRSKKTLVVLLGVTLIAIVAAAAAGLPLFPSDLDMGRRGEVYAFEGSLNYLFFLVTTPLYFGILGFVWYEHVRLNRAPDPILYQSLAFCVSAFAISFAFEAGGRLFYLMDALVIWTLSRSWIGRVPVGAWAWACAQLSLSFYYSYKDNFGEDSLWGRAGAILGLW